MNRRGFLGAILAAGAAPALVRASSLMPIWVPNQKLYIGFDLGEANPSSAIVIAREGEITGFLTIHSMSKRQYELNLARFAQMNTLGQTGFSPEALKALGPPDRMEWIYSTQSKV